MHTVKINIFLFMSFIFSRIKRLCWALLIIYYIILIIYIFHTCIYFCRYGREGHLSYYRLDRLVPAEVSLTKSDINFLSRAMDITHKGMRTIIGRMAKFLGVRKIICPDLLSLINRYCTELALPSTNVS